MIEINLLPGAGKKARGAGAGAAVGASFATAASKVKDPFTALAAASVIVVRRRHRGVDLPAAGESR